VARRTTWGEAAGVAWGFLERTGAARAGTFSFYESSDSRSRVMETLNTILPIGWFDEEIE